LGQGRALPAAGTGPFHITGIVARQEGGSAPWESYWDPSGRRQSTMCTDAAPRTRIREPPCARSGRLARSAPADWLGSVWEISGFPSDRLLRMFLAPGLQHRARPTAPSKSGRVDRRELVPNRSGRGLVSLLSGKRSPSGAWLKTAISISAIPSTVNSDPPNARRCSPRPDAPRTSRVVTSLILAFRLGANDAFTENESRSQTSERACGVTVGIRRAIEWSVILTAAAPARRQIARRLVSISDRHLQMTASWSAILSANVLENDFSIEQWKDDEFRSRAEDDLGGARSESHLGRLSQGA